MIAVGFFAVPTGEYVVPMGEDGWPSLLRNTRAGRRGIGRVGVVAARSLIHVNLACVFLMVDHK